MFHPDTQFLIEHWTRLARGPAVRAGVPDRASLRPDALGLRLPRVFMLDLSHAAPSLALAGGWIEAFHDRTLKDAPFAEIWKPGSETLALSAIHQTVREGRPVVLAASVGIRRSPIELAFVPFRSGAGTVDRILGLYAPVGTLSFARDEPRLLTARLALGVGEPGRPALNLAAVHGRRVA